MEESKTVFIAGLPQDVKERELNLIFQNQPGFVAVTLRTDGMGRPMGFAAFNDHVAAANAVVALHEVVLDPSNPMPLRLELARSNSRSFMKRTRDGEMEFPPPKVSHFARGPPTWAPPGMGAPPMQRYGHSHSMAPANSTVFITGLGPLTPASVMNDICAGLPGFDRLKVDREGLPNACCFVRFHTPAEAMSAIRQLQGYPLPSGNTLRCEMARSDMGSRMAPYGAPPVYDSPYPPRDPASSFAPPSSSTLFITGLGEQINAHDMTALCQTLYGFERLKLDKEGQPNACCFVLFKEQVDAHHALQQLSGYEMNGAVLRCDFAKSDLGMPKAGFHPGYPPAPPPPRFSPPGPMFGGSQYGGPQYGGPKQYGGSQYGGMPSGAPRTLFISGLGLDITAAELQGLCSTIPGFDTLKVDNEGQPRACAFARFMDPSSASAAFHTVGQSPLKGRYLTVEFARQDLGTRR